MTPQLPGGDEHDTVAKAVISGEPAHAHRALLLHVDMVGASFEKLVASTHQISRPTPAASS